MPNGTLQLGNMIATPNANVTAPQTAAATAAGWKPVNPVATPPVTTPTLESQLDDANTAKTNAYSTVATPNANDRSAATAQFQSEIDALNQVYAQQKQAETQAGANRLGSNTAIEARRGLLGSDMGTAATNNVNDANAQAQQAIDAKHNLDLAAVTGQISQSALDAAKARVTAAQQGADAKVNEIKGRVDNATSSVSNAVKAAIAQGMDPSKLVVNQSQINQWAQQYGVDPNVVTNAIQTEVQIAQNNAAADAKLRADAVKAALDNALTTANIADKNASTKKILNEINNPTLKPLTTAQLKVAINKQIATPEFQALTDTEKASYIRAQGGTPYDYGY